jgi:hypothetical protein
MARSSEPHARRAGTWSCHRLRTRCTSIVLPSVPSVGYQYSCGEWMESWWKVRL